MGGHYMVSLWRRTPRLESWLLSSSLVILAGKLSLPEDGRKLELPKCIPKLDLGNERTGSAIRMKGARIEFFHRRIACSLRNLHNPIAPIQFAHRRIACSLRNVHNPISPIQFAHRPIKCSLRNVHNPIAPIQFAHCPIGFSLRNVPNSFPTIQLTRLRIRFSGG
jgi:hypothetical protein